MRRVTSLEIVAHEELGQGGFLVLQRHRLRNVYDDGSRSAEYPVDHVDRPRGLDAVAVVLWRRGARGVEVLIRGQLRPSLQLGRARAHLAVPDGPLPLFNPEIVAGLIEREDAGEEGLRGRCVAEIHEEAGYTVAPGELVRLGAGTFPASGVIPERHHYFAVDIGAREPATADGDGSPLEDSHERRWLGLDEAIAACLAGDIVDSKTEIALRRLRDRLDPARGGEGRA
jgi:ADP-ribose pyrophosphatase